MAIATPGPDGFEPHDGHANATDGIDAVDAADDAGLGNAT